MRYYQISKINRTIGRYVISPGLDRNSMNERYSSLVDLMTDLVSKNKTRKLYIKFSNNINPQVKGLASLVIKEHNARARLE